LSVCYIFFDNSNVKWASVKVLLEQLDLPFETNTVVSENGAAKNFLGLFPGR